MTNINQISMTGIKNQIENEYPKLRIKKFSSHEIRILNPERTGLGITLNLPHSDAKLEGTAFSAETKEVITETKDGRFQVEEQSRWIDIPQKQDVSFDKWLSKWLKLING